MPRFRTALAAAFIFAALFTLPASAGSILLYDWETGLEGWGSAGAGIQLANSTTLGVSHGAQSLVLDNLTKGFKGNASTNPGSAKVTSGSVFNAWTAIGNAYVGGATDLKLEFDFTYDNSLVTVDRFAQFSIFLNSALGYTEYSTGQLLQGNTGGAGTLFPSPGSNAITDNVSITSRGPNSIHVAIPFAGADPDGPGPFTGGRLAVGPGTFFEIGFKTNGNWEGTLDWAIDNLRVSGSSIPEPSALVLAGLAAGAFLARRARRR